MFWPGPGWSAFTRGDDFVYPWLLLPEMKEKGFSKIIFGLLLTGGIFILGFLAYQDWQDSHFVVVNRHRAGIVYSKPKREGPLSSILFTGDIMMDRGVEYQIKKHNDWFYPFLKIKPFLSQFNMVVGNLEGPIVANPPAFPSRSL